MEQERRWGGAGMEVGWGREGNGVGRGRGGVRQGRWWGGGRQRKGGGQEQGTGSKTGRLTIFAVLGGVAPQFWARLSWLRTRVSSEVKASTS